MIVIDNDGFMRHELRQQLMLLFETSCEDTNTNDQEKKVVPNNLSTSLLLHKVYF